MLALARDPRVKVTGFVEEVAPLLASMHAAVVPWIGRYGFRSRVVELMAVGVPVVATPDAVAGMDLHDGEEILLGESTEELARALVALLCSGFTVGLMNVEARDAASDYRSSENVGFGAASLELDARYNIGKYFHVGLTVAGEAWLGELSAQRSDGSELFRSRLFNGSALLGLGLHF